MPLSVEAGMKHTGRATSKLGRLLVTEEGVVVLESQQWRTPRPLAVAVARHMGITVYPGAPPFDLDAAADDSCSLGTFHFSAERSCLLHDWVSWLSWASSPTAARRAEKAPEARASVIQLASAPSSAGDTGLRAMMICPCTLCAHLCGVCLA